MERLDREVEYARALDERHDGGAIGSSAFNTTAAALPGVFGAIIIMCFFHTRGCGLIREWDLSASSWLALGTAGAAGAPTTRTVTVQNKSRRMTGVGCGTARALRARRATTFTDFGT